MFWPMASFKSFNPQCAMTEPAKVSRHVLIDNCDLTSVFEPTPQVTANPVNGAVVYVDDCNRAQHAQALSAAQEALLNRLVDALEKRMDARLASLNMKVLRGWISKFCLVSSNS